MRFVLLMLCLSTCDVANDDVDVVDCVVVVMRLFVLHHMGCVYDAYVVVVDVIIVVDVNNEYDV